MAGINMDTAAPGLGRLALAIGGRGYQKGFDDQLGLQSKLAQAIASQANARLHNAQADEAEAQLAGRQPEAVLRTALTTNGIPTDEADAVTEYLKTGELGGKYRAPVGGMGPVAPAPEWMDKLGPVARSVGTTQGALALGDKSIENVAKAEGLRREQGLSDAVLQGGADPTKVAVAQYAASGKAPYAFHEFGTGNNLTGAVDDQNAPAQRFGQYRTAETGAADARRTASLASADSSRASAEHSRALTNEVKNGPKGVLVQTDQGPVFADQRTGKSTPVLNPDGTPASPKLKDIPAAQNHAFIENGKALDNIDAAMKAIYEATGIRLNENGDPVRDPNFKPKAPNALGARNYLGDDIRQRTDPEGVSVRAQVTNIGGQKFHDLSGAAVTASEAPRLKPFIPSSTDGPAAALTKLANLRREYQNVNTMMADTYSREQGYRPSVAARPGKGGQGGARPQAGNANGRPPLSSFER